MFNQKMLRNHCFQKFHSGDSDFRSIIQKGKSQRHVGKAITCF